MPMTHLQQSMLLSLLAGIAIPVGGALAAIENIHPAWLEKELRHGIIAFGGGALFSAVALVLVPEGIKTLTIVDVAICFSGGGLIFLAVDYLMTRRGGAISQVLAMLLDFVPEAMALGAMITKEAPTAGLIAFLIGLQNLPEGFNAYREVKTNRYFSGRVTLLIFLALALLGPLSSFFGLTYLSGHARILDRIMLFCAGGILYLIFQDIAPQVKLQRSWAPPLGAIAGFLLGVIGHMLIIK